MYSEKDILAKSWLVKECCNLVLSPREVDKIFLIGSYASGKETPSSDLDFLVQLKPPGLLYPDWDKIIAVHKKIDNKKVHVIFGTEQAAKSLYEKHKLEKKSYQFKEIQLEESHALTRS